MRSFAKVLALLMFALCVTAIPARAQDAGAGKPAKIAVVDIQSLLRDSKAAKSIESQLDGVRKSFQSEVGAEEKALRVKEKAIMDKKASMSEDEFKSKAEAFQKDVAASQKKVQDKKAELDKAVGTAIGKLRAEIVKVVAEIGDKQNLDLVLSRTDVVIVSKTMDITADVLKRIDEELPSVSVDVGK
ncbi:MAG: OmpH family outer membrane protein [Rhodospirillales bacterium]|nr:OmpH family outer membrane protein [Alphaproteobacteria bacterium]MCB9987381.1 OmpH family outer membrane protein [Rhodospirillales bacterium]USO07772.1 MAG: OmpH family outer membrane protein [Rhodospirillales bacterium]